MMQNIVVFTGAGISADSGLATFRDSNGLWAHHKIEEVCTPEALERNRSKVIDFYNLRRKELLEKQPNAGHLALVDLEKKYHVEVITQNVDDLHERAGSKHITHLHGELRKLRSSRNELGIVPIEGWEQQLETRHQDGSLLRPHIVFFGEPVPLFQKATQIALKANILIVAGTSLAVYPAASLIRYINPQIPVYLIDPGTPEILHLPNPLVHIKEKAAIGLPKLTQRLLEE